jgi:hypothetical protein
MFPACCLHVPRMRLNTCEVHRAQLTNQLAQLPQQRLSALVGPGNRQDYATERSLILA